MTTVYIAFDLFLRDWDQSDQGEVWAAITPFVEDTNHNIIDYLTNIENRDFQLKFDPYKIGGNLPDPARLVAVPLPSRINFGLTVTENGVENTVSVKRNQRIKITDLDGFRNLNRPLKKKLEGKEKDGTSVQTEQFKAILPYAQLYNESIVKQLKAANLKRDDQDGGGLLPEENAIILQQANMQYFGSRFRISKNLLSEGDLKDDHLLILSDKDADPIITGFHSLVGQMLYLGDTSYDLTNISDINVLLESTDGDASTPIDFTLNFSDDKAASQYLRNMLKEVPSNKTFQEEKLYSIEELKKAEHSIRNRVYVKHNLMALKKWPSSNIYSTREEKNVDLDLTSLEVIKVRKKAVVIPDNSKVQKKVTDSDKITLPDIQKIEFQLHALFEGSFNRYRNVPDMQDKKTIAWFKPASVDRNDYLNYFNKTTLPDGGIKDAIGKKKIEFLDENGGAIDGCEFIDVYAFPWDEADENISSALIELNEQKVIPLFNIPVKLLGEVNLSVTVYDKNSKAMSIYATKKTITADAGDRAIETFWEGRTSEEFRESITFPEFNYLKLQGETAADIAVSIGFKKDRLFTFACSASRHELVCRSEFPAVHGDDGPTKPEDAFVEDLINHNSLNIYEGNTLLNDYVEELPKFYHKTDDEPLKHQFTYHSILEFHDPELGLPKKDLSTFFGNQMELAKNGRNISVDLEHRYGTRLKKVSLPPSFPAKLDKPPVIASAVKFKKEKDKQVITSAAKPAEEKITDSFLKVSYIKDGAIEKLILTFDKEFLRLIEEKGKHQQLAHYNAIRSLVELQYADDIELEVRLFSFDANQLLNDSSSTRQIGSALKISEVLTISITNTVQQTAKSLLAGKDVDGVVEITLPKDQKISGHCNVFEVILKVQRDDERIFPFDDISKYSLNAFKGVDNEINVRDLFDKNGRTLVCCDKSSVKHEFKAYLKTLESGEFPVEPDSHPLTAKFKKIVGSDNQGSVRAWMDPGKPLEQESKSINLTLFPLGFRPLAKNNGLFKARTDFVIKQYFEYLDQLINLNPTTLGNRNSDSPKERLNQLQTAAIVINNNVRAVAKLIWPEPFTNDSSEGNHNLIAHMKAFKKGDARDDLVEAVYRLLVNKPSIYSSIKGLLFTGIAIMDKKVDPSLYQYKNKKQIKMPKGDDTGELSDAVEFNILQALSFNDGLKKFYGFLENMEDVEFDNEFDLENVSLHSFEDFIESKKDPSIASSLQIPGGIYDSKVNKRIHLASRKRVVDPTAIIFDQFTDELKFKDMLEIPFSSYRKKEWNSSQDNSDGEYDVQVCVAHAQNKGKGSPQVDDKMVYAVFSIQADEEASQNNDWENSLNNDEFYISLDGGTGNNRKNELQEVGGNKVGSSVLSTIASGDTPDWNSLLDKSVLSSIESLVKPSDKPDGIDKVEVTFNFEADDNKGTLKANITNTPKEYPYIEIFLFRSKAAIDQPSANSTVDTANFHIVIKAELSVWNIHQVTLSQSRNVGVGFDPYFHDFSLAVGGGQTLRLNHVANVKTLKGQYSPVVLSNKKISIDELLGKLKDKRLIADVEKAKSIGEGEDFTLTLTIYHIHKLPIKRAFFEDREQEMTDALDWSRHPILSYVDVQNNQKFTNDDIYSVYEDIEIDFSWADKFNNPFFQLIRVPFKKQI